MEFLGLPELALPGRLRLALALTEQRLLGLAQLEMQGLLEPRLLALPALELPEQPLLQGSELLAQLPWEWL